MEELNMFLQWHVQAKAEIERLKEEISSKDAAVVAAQQDGESHKVSTCNSHRHSK